MLDSDWIHGEIPVHSEVDFRLQFVAKHALDEIGYLAIDDFELREDANCQLKPKDSSPDGVETTLVPSDTTTVPTMMTFPTVTSTTTEPSKKVILRVLSLDVVVKGNKALLLLLVWSGDS